MKNLIIILILSFTLTQIVQAQRTVTGKIIDLQGTPLSGVNIFVKGTDNGTLTDSLGRYSIIIPEGEKSLIFKKDDYQVQEVRIDKDVVNMTMTLDNVNLFDLSIEELMNIEITTASKYAEPVSQTPTTVFVITKKDLENRGYTTLSEVLNDLPGFDIAASYGNLNQLVYARGNRTGSYNERTMLMIDGVESNILYAQNMNISSDFPLTSIDRIEILYGPASAIYGPNVFSGIINIITKSASDLENNSNKTYVQSGIGDNNTQFTEITYLANYNPIELSISYRRYKSDMFDMTDKPGYFSSDLFGNPDLWGPYAEYYPEFDNKVDDNAFLGRIKVKNVEFGYNHLLTKHGNGSEYPYDKTMPTTNWKFARDILFLKYNKDLGDKFKFSFLATYQKSGSPADNVWIDGVFSDNNWDSLRTVEMRTWKYMSTKWCMFQDFEYQPLNYWKISGGVKLSSAEFQKKYDYGYSDITTWLPGEQWTEASVLFPQPIVNSTRPNSTYSDIEWGGFIQSKLLLFDDKLAFVAGLRYDYNEIYGAIYSPRIGATYRVSDYLGIKTSYGTGFQEPAPRSLYAWAGVTANPDLKPDKIQAFDFSLISTISNLGVEVAFYDNIIANSILQGVNLPDYNIFGLECKINYILVSSGQYINNASIHLNYSYTNATFADALTDASTGRSSDKIGDIAPNKLNLILNADLFKYLHFNIRMNYVDKRTTVVSNPVEEVDAFFVTYLNFQLINIFDNKIKVFFNINNVFDKEYYHPGMDAANAGEDLSTPSDGWYSSRLPQPGRSFNAGIYLTF